MAGHVMTG